VSKFVIFSSAAIFLPALFLYFLWQDRRTALNPMLWQQHYSRTKLMRYANYCLRANGWTTLPPWEWINVWVRAVKGESALNLVVYDREIYTLRSLTNDVLESNSQPRHVIGILTFETVTEELRESAHGGCVFYINPNELLNVEEIYGSAKLNAADRTELGDCGRLTDKKVLDRIATPVESAEVHVNLAISVDKVADELRGFVEAISERKLWGWAYCRLAPDEHVRIEAKISGNVAGVGVANVFRPDLLNAKIGSGDHSFEITIAAEFTILDKKLLTVEAIAENGQRSILPLP
jgi:hypothetical protein